MRTIKNLTDVQIVLKEILDWKDTQLSKAKDQRGHQIKNAGDATEPTDLVTLRQLESAFPPGSKIGGTTIITKITSGTGGGGTGPKGDKGDQGDPGPPGPSGVANARNLVPTGTLDGVNKVFTLPEIPITNSLILQLNGVTQEINNDFTLSGLTITYLFAPKSDDWHRASYFV